MPLLSYVTGCNAALGLTEFMRSEGSVRYDGGFNIQVAPEAQPYYDLFRWIVDDRLSCGFEVNESGLMVWHEDQQRIIETGEQPPLAFVGATMAHAALDQHRMTISLASVRGKSWLDGQRAFIVAASSEEALQTITVLASLSR